MLSHMRPFDCHAADRSASALGEAAGAGVVHDAPAMIWATDPAGALVYANRRFGTIFGIAAEDLPGRGWDLVLAPEALAGFRAALAHCIAGRLPFHAEVQVRTADGALRWHRCEATPKIDHLGSLLGYVGCNLDITEGRQVETALRELNATLERRVAERTAQLAAEAAARSAAQDRLRHTQKLEALGQLSGGVAHDFNNASAAILAGIALLEKRHGPALAAAPATSGLLAGLQEAAERGAAISRRMLAFARREELRATEVDPTEVLRNLRAVLANAIGPVVRVVVDAPAALPALRVDRAQLETTLINLAVNARDSMPAGGTVTLGAEIAEVVPDPMARAAPPISLAPGQYTRLWVADTGIGMEPAILTRAAEPFFTTKPRDKGTGLGLSMADGFAAQSGGAMRIESAPGCGTAVSLWLPCAMEQRVPDAARPAARGRALVVDDQPMMRRFLAECLGHEGWEVQEAEDGGEALVYLDAGKRCDLLISDLSMPGMDGTALIQTARQKRPDLTAVLLTGSGRMADLAPMAERGGYVLLRKPVSPSELADCLAGLPAPMLPAGPGSGAEASPGA